MKIKMVENIMQFLKSISIMFLINLLVFYFLGFEYLNNQLFIILAIIYILILLTYRKSYRLIIYLGLCISCTLILFMIINRKLSKKCFAILVVILLINLIASIYLYKNNNKKKCKVRLKEMFEERKRDLKRLRESLKIYNIIGLNGDWGTGKSLIIEYLKQGNKNDYNFIEIDLLSLNLDDIKYSIIDEINILLKDNGMFSRSSRRLKNIFSSHHFLSIIGNYLNIGSVTFNEALNGLKLDLCQLDKPTVIIYEDVDRINNIDIIKSLFDINEKLAENTEKIKIIYQYYDKNLREKYSEISERYLEKYIEYNVNLTDIELYRLIILKLKESEEYKKVIGKEKVVDIFLNKDITIGDKYYRREIKYQEYNSIRRIERFLKDSYNNINRLKADGLSSSEDLIIRTVLIFNSIKYFYPSIYEEITIDKNILETFTLNIDGKEYSYDYFCNKDKIKDLQNYIEAKDNMSETKRRNLFNLFILNKLQYNIHGQFYKDIYKFGNAIEKLDRHYEESDIDLIKRHNNMVMDRIFWNLLSAGKSELTELEVCGQKLIEDVLSYDKSNWKNRYIKYCNALYHSGHTIFIIGIEESLQLFKSFKIINPEEKYWIKLLDFSKEEFFNVIDYEFISAINYVPMDNINIHKKISELILGLRIEGNLNDEKEFLKFLRKFYKTWHGVGRAFPLPVEYLNYINMEDSNYIQTVKSILEAHIESLDNIESFILEDEIKLNIKVTKKLLELIGLEESLKMKEHKPKTSLTSSSDKRIIIEELQNLKEIDLDKFIKKVEEYYLSGQISKRNIIKELKI